MKVFKAIFAGIVGGLAMTGLGWLARAGGLDYNAEMLLGTMLGYAVGQDAWLVGLALHLVISIFIALLYAAGFEAVAHRAGPAAGFSFSVVHMAIAGMALVALPELHHMIPEPMPAPGPFMVNMGAPIVGVFIAEHILFGILVGTIYGSVLHPRTHAVMVA
ncbi:MAG: hypothetical protein ACT4P6_21315 [Gemmatimonadaceae bacterium]